MLVHHDAFAAVAETAIVLGLEARDILLELRDGVVGGAAYAGAAKDDHAAHGWGLGWLVVEFAGIEIGFGIAFAIGSLRCGGVVWCGITTRGVYFFCCSSGRLSL